MVPTATSEPFTEQSRDSEICLLCGFCCDGTLFDRAVTGPGDTGASLVTIGLTPIAGVAGEITGFRLPCPQFAGKCAIYTSSRPSICEKFRCRLLRLVQKGKYTVSEAQQIVLATRALRDALPPNFDALKPGASRAGASVENRDRSLLSRIITILPKLMNPEEAEFREKCGRVALPLIRHIRKYFYPVRKPGESLASCKKVGPG
jgi:hypothetical protein